MRVPTNGAVERWPAVNIRGSTVALLFAKPREGSELGEAPAAAPHCQLGLDPSGQVAFFPRGAQEVERHGPGRHSHCLCRSRTSRSIAVAIGLAARTSTTRDALQNVVPEGRSQHDGGDGDGESSDLREPAFGVVRSNTPADVEAKALDLVDLVLQGVDLVLEIRLGRVCVGRESRRSSRLYH